MKKLIIFFLFLFVLAGCNNNNDLNKTKNISILERLKLELGSGKQIIEIKNPEYKLPNDIYPEQIKKTFRIGDVFFALAIKPNKNITFNKPLERPTKFVGVLISDWKSKEWQKYIEITNDRNNGNIPFYIWSNDSNIYLSIVDHNSDKLYEGNMKLLKSQAGGDWSMNKCYLFGSDYESFETNGDYFKYSKYLNKQKEQDLDNCNNLKFEVY